MKAMKRLALMVAAVVATLALAVPAFAATPTGNVTVNNAVDGETYTVYRVLDLQGESYPTSDKANYLYKASTGWDSFVSSSGAGSTYVDVDHDEYVTWKDGVSTDSSDVKPFAEAALTYASENSIVATATAKASNGTVTFSGLPIGYYVLTSSAGTNPISFNVAAANVTVNEKNEAPTVEKKIVENGSTTDKNSVSIGDTVEFQTTIEVKAGAKNYVLHDAMEAGLTFDVSSGVTSVGLIKSGTTNEESVSASNYDTTAGDESDNACTFHVTFNQDWLDGLSAEDKIVVHYQATLNENATTGTDPNTNGTWLAFGDNSTTTHDETETYTYKFQIIKTDGGNENGTQYDVLTGAVFELYAGNSVSGTPISFVATGDGYRVAKNGESGATTEIAAGAPVITGLEAGTYTLHEKTAPTGYNKASDTTFELNADNVVVSGVITEASGDQNGTFTPNGEEGIQVINHDGSMLPSTGGMGTILFYALGAILVIGAVVGIVVLKRRSAQHR